MLGRLLRPSKKVVKIKIQGPLNTKLQQSFMAQFPKINPRKTQALIIILNSYGGSLPVAKNIAASLQLIQQQKVPVYCFAQQFCLNSANIILASGTELIGDYGYAMQHYSGQQLNKKYNVGIDVVGSTPKAVNILFSSYQINNVQKTQKIVEDLANQLKKEVIAYRQGSIRSKGMQVSDYSWMQGGSLKPQNAIEMGLIDGLNTQNQFIQQRLKDFKVVNKVLQKDFGKYWRNLYQMFRQQ